MTSLFRDDCEYETKIAESGALDWLIENWEYIEGMFEDINARNISTVVITSRSTLKTHEQYLQKTFDGNNLVFERLNSYTHHSGDYFPSDAKYPFFVLPDASLQGETSTENSQLTALAEETRNSVFYIVFQTTRGEGRIEKYENVYWLTLSKTLRTNGVTFEANRIGEIAALTLFGETRSRGFMSMLWLDFRYEDISNIDNIHFANIIRESVVSPFYLSREISEYPVFMGYSYSFRDDLPSRRASLTKSKKSVLRSRPRITRPSTPPRENNSDNIDDSPDPEIEETEDVPTEGSEIEDIEIEEFGITVAEVDKFEEIKDEIDEPSLIRPPSPQRAKLPSIESPKRKPIKKTAKKGTTKKTTKKGITKKTTKPSTSAAKSKKSSKTTNKKPKPGMVINPNTGRNVKINSKRYRELVQAGVLEPI